MEELLESILAELVNIRLELEAMKEQSRIQHDYPRQVEVMGDRGGRR